MSLTSMKQILVPVDGSPASMEAVALACNVAKRNKGKVYAVYVVQVHRSLPLDAELNAENDRGEKILAEAERVADENDFTIEGEILQARDVSHAVVDEAVERGVDGIMLGVEYKAPSGMGFEWPRGGKPVPIGGDFGLGSVPLYILQHAPCEVWLIRRAPQSGAG